jgi:integrase/recombinase XerD
MDALLAAPDRNTALGRRDYTLLLFLYNSGARISEASNLPINKLNLRPNAMSHVEIFGKGGKTRCCPLWATTAGELVALTRNRSSNEPVFVNRHGQAITRHGVHRLIRKYVRKAMAPCPSLANKCISPHTIRQAWAYYTTFQSPFILKTIGFGRREFAEVYGHHDVPLSPLVAPLEAAGPFSR